MAANRFLGVVKAALQKIISKPVGRTMLEHTIGLSDRAEFGYTVCIMRPSGLGPQWNGGSVAERAHENGAWDGAGTVTQVVWNANVIHTPAVARPAFIAPAHDMINALYNPKGDAFRATSMEEYCAVGLPPVATRREITEYPIRGEHNVPRRSLYYIRVGATGADHRRVSDAG